MEGQGEGGKVSALTVLSLGLLKMLLLLFTAPHSHPHREEDDLRCASRSQLSKPMGGNIKWVMPPLHEVTKPSTQHTQAS